MRARRASTDLPVRAPGGAGGRIRTCVAVKRRFYRPLDLTTLPPLPVTPRLDLGVHLISLSSSPRAAPTGVRTSNRLRSLGTPNTLGGTEDRPKEYMEQPLPGQRTRRRLGLTS